MPYIDSRDHYTLRMQEVTWATMRRAYYGGYPYTDNELELYESSTWQNLMNPTEEENDWPAYYDNLARIIIENTVNDILPSESSIAIEGIDKLDGDTADFYRALFNFGTGYEHLPQSFISWAKKVLSDVAQPGNGLIFLRLMPETETEPARIQWDYYPMEAWCAEQTAKNLDPEFYRIEYKYDVVSGDNERVTYWHRVDIYRDHIVRYYDEPALINNFNTDIPQGQKFTTSDTFATLLPPNMTVMQPDPVADAAEREIMKQLSGWVCIPLIWDRRHPNDLKGCSPLRINRLQGIDQVNRLETEWSDAAVEHGNPQEYAVDLELPGEEGGERDETTANDFTRRDIMSVVSNGQTTQRGEMTYSNNIPTSLLHKEPLDSLRLAVFEGDPNFTINPETIGRFGELSGFANGLLNKNHDSKVRNLRDDLVYNGLMLALRRAMEMLKAVDQLPSGINTDAKLSVKLSGRDFSPDEELKMATTLSMMVKLNLPDEDIMAYAHKFMDIGNETEFVKSIQEYKKMAQEALLMAKQAHEANPAPGNNSPGTDNKLK